MHLLHYYFVGAMKVLGGMVGIAGLQGYTKSELHPKQGTFTKVGDNGGPPFMGADPNVKPYTSMLRTPLRPALLWRTSS